MQNRPLFKVPSKKKKKKNFLFKRRLFWGGDAVGLELRFWAFDRKPFESTDTFKESKEKNKIKKKSFNFADLHV